MPAVFSEPASTKPAEPVISRAGPAERRAEAAIERPYGRPPSPRRRSSGVASRRCWSRWRVAQLPAQPRGGGYRVRRLPATRGSAVPPPGGGRTASTAWTRTYSPSNWRSSPCGSKPMPRACRSRSLTTGWCSAIRSPGRSSSTCSRIPSNRANLEGLFAEGLRSDSGGTDRGACSGERTGSGHRRILPELKKKEALKRKLDAALAPSAQWRLPGPAGSCPTRARAGISGYRASGPRGCRARRCRWLTRRRYLST